MRKKEYRGEKGVRGGIHPWGVEKGRDDRKRGEEEDEKAKKEEGRRENKNCAFLTVNTGFVGEDCRVDKKVARTDLKEEGRLKFIKAKKNLKKLILDWNDRNCSF